MIVQEIGYVGDCVPQLLQRVAIFISVSCQYNVLLEHLFTHGFKILTNLHNMNLYTVLCRRRKVAVLNKMSSNATPN